jgi:hypothetical protein
MDLDIGAIEHKIDGVDLVHFCLQEQHIQN